MTQILEPRLNRRQVAKAATRQKVMDAAAALFADGYGSATIRDIAKAAGMSTGAVFANFTDKADLWRQVMGTEPPVETSVTRAAPAMLAALLALQAVRPSNWDDDQDPETLAAWLKADEVIAQAEGRA
jgi:AcrR family transcriptional regulator